MEKTKSFKKSLILTLLSFAVIPSLLVGIFFLVLSTDRILEAKKTFIGNLVKTITVGINESIAGEAREVAIMAKDQEVNEYLNTYFGDKKNLGESQGNVQNDLTDWANSNIYYDNAIIASPQGIIINASDPKLIGKDISLEPYFNDTLMTSKQLIISDKISSINGNGRDVIALSKVTTSTGGKNAVIILYIALDFFQEYAKSISFGNSGYAYIIDNSDNFIYHADSTKIGDKIQSGTLTNIIDSFRKSNTKEIYSATYTFNGVATYGSFKEVPQTGWIIGVRENWNDILYPLFGIFEAVFLAIIFAIIMGIIISNRFANYFMNPINKLRFAISSATEKNQYVKCEVEVNNEFGELSKGYNIMAETLKKTFDKLKMAYQDLLKKERENYKLMNTDNITGLQNRISLYETFKTNFEEVENCGVIFIDLDNFKNINDVFGHNVGDDLLRKVANLIINIEQNENNIYTRFGGDEFVVVKKGNIEEIKNYVEKMIEAFSKKVELENLIVNISASIGISMFPNNGKNIDTLIKNADIAMYEAKAEGKNQYFLFNAMLENKIKRTACILSVLKNCIELNECYPIFQPEIDFKTGKILGFEALIRINNSELGLLSPVEFVPVAENSGLIEDLGLYMLMKSCEFFKELIDFGYDLSFISVNISAYQMHHTDFVNKIINVVKKTNLDFHYLQLEVTESMIMKNIDDSIKKLNQLRELGISIAIDDFGTSYSSFSHLINLPIDVIKIDKIFVDGILESEKKQIVIKSIVDMTHSLGAKTVAEGVEINEQKILLTELNCDIMQGFLFSKPISKEEVKELLLKQI